ncbi:MAG TPA: hypothetical protein DEP37_09675 [Algoriphagus sp.]|nr:hypothetical protein [Algoriphagus sp.]
MHLVKKLNEKGGPSIFQGGHLFSFIQNWLFYSLLFLLFSCNDVSIKELPTTILEPNLVFDEFEGPIFFTNVQFESDKNHIYLINARPSMFIVLNKKFEIQSLVERRGNGPDDLDYPIQLQKSKYGVLIEDRGNYKISIVSPKDGSHIDEIPIPESVGHTRFFFQDDTFYFPMVGYKSDTSSVLKFNLLGEPIGKTGLLMPEGENAINRQARLIQPLQDKLVLIGVNLPYIDILSTGDKHELVKRHRWDQFEPLKRALDSLENDFNKPGYEVNEREIKSIVIDAQIVKDRLYVTFTDRIGLDRSKARHLLEFKIDNSSLEYVRAIRFQTGTPDDNLHPTAFHIDESAKKIYTQGLITKQIYVFDLPLD